MTIQQVVHSISKFGIILTVGFTETTSRNSHRAFGDGQRTATAIGNGIVGVCIPVQSKGNLVCSNRSARRAAQRNAV